jgi:hypothetical protein
MTLNKPLGELTNFNDLLLESKQQERPWDLVIVAALSGINSVMPSDKEALAQLEIMMKTVETGGNLSKYMAFDKQGIPVMFR